METAVLVVGGGPVGLTLAMDLAQRGIDVTVAEQRAPGDAPEPKCNHIAARSMEAFRRLGVAGALREAGLPADFPNDVAYRTTATGAELTRIPIPSRSNRYEATGGPDTWWPTPEPPHRINQIYIEPVLQQHAARHPNLRHLTRTHVSGFVESDDAVVTTLQNVDDGERWSITSDYLVGCDGARSNVRKAIGATLNGDPRLQLVQSSFIRAPRLIDLMSSKPAWANFSVNPRRSGNMYAIDGRELWVIHNYLLRHETDFDAVDRDACIREILGVDSDFDYQIISKEDWVARRLVADRLRQGRAFICGDAAHIWVPMAGYGMNAGIADAMDLSWQLAGRLRGWGGPRLLDAYQAERLPVTEQVSRYAMSHQRALADELEHVPAEIEEQSPAGVRARARVGERLYQLNVAQYCCGGLNFGYFYDGSPVIAYDSQAAPPYTMDDFVQSTVPGCRTPHLWMEDNRSLYDAVGPEFTLLRRDRALDVQPLLAAAARRSVPIEVVDLSGPEAGALYPTGLVLSRPDLHVGWRGDAVPDDPVALIDRVRGAI